MNILKYSMSKKLIYESLLIKLVKNKIYDFMHFSALLLASNVDNSLQHIHKMYVLQIRVLENVCII
jgi:pyruvate-formate lyase